MTDPLCSDRVPITLIVSLDDAYKLNYPRHCAILIILLYTALGSTLYASSGTRQNKEQLSEFVLRSF